MKELKYLTNDRLSHVVTGAGARDEVVHSYQILEGIMVRFPKEYIQQLNCYTDSDDPIQTGHSDIMSRFSYPPLDAFVEKVGKIRVRNIRGGMSEVTAWKMK